MLPESSEEEFDRHEKILSSHELQINLGCYSWGKETEGFVQHPFLPLPMLGLSRVEQYLLQRCHEENPIEILVGDPCFSISCVLSSCGVGHHGAFPEEDWTRCLGARASVF